MKAHTNLKWLQLRSCPTIMEEELSNARVREVGRVCVLSLSK